MQSYKSLPNDVEYNEEVFNKIAVAVREHSEIAAVNMTPLSHPGNAYRHLTGGDLENAQRSTRKAYQFSNLLIKLMDGEITASEADRQYSRIKNR